MAYDPNLPSLSSATARTIRNAVQDGLDYYVQPGRNVYDYMIEQGLIVGPPNRPRLSALGIRARELLTS